MSACSLLWLGRQETVAIANQTAITKDNVTITIDGVLYLRVHNPEQASYGVQDATYAVAQLAQTTMRSELGTSAHCSQWGRECSRDALTSV